MVLAFCFIGGCPGFSCNLIWASLVVQFVLNNISKLVVILSFSDWSVNFFLLLMFCIVQINARSQYISSSGLMCSRSVLSSGNCLNCATLGFYRNFSGNLSPVPFDVLRLFSMVILFCLLFFLCPAVLLYSEIPCLR